MKVDNAIIMAAGTSSRFAPLSYEVPKGLIEVKGEILMERQIRQLKEAGIKEIYVVVGYKQEQFMYLEEKFGVKIVINDEYLDRNNNGSLYAVKDVLGNSYICSSDNYFKENPFETEVDEAYYAAVYADGETNEWCMEEDEEGFISKVTIGGRDAWYMLGHTFWSRDFSKKFMEILEPIYNDPDIINALWERVFLDHLDQLKMKIRRYPADYIYEFDTVDELREFDPSYVDNTRSEIIKQCASELHVRERDISGLEAVKDMGNEAEGFTFVISNIRYIYNYSSKVLRRQ